MATATAATATVDEAAAEPPKKGKKKLLIIIGAAVLLLALAGGGATIYLLNKRAADAAAAEAAEDGEAGEVAEAAPAKEQRDEKKHPPIFVPLDMFTVNLADRDADRFAQVGITLEIEDAKVADQLKQYMPAIRNNILMVIAHKTSAELLEREGKLRLAREIQRESLRPLGVELPAESRRARLLIEADETMPVKAVHFSNFIIQ